MRTAAPKKLSKNTCNGNRRIESANARVLEIGVNVLVIIRGGRRHHRRQTEDGWLKTFCWQLCLLEKPEGPVEDGEEWCWSDNFYQQRILSSILVKSPNINNNPQPNPKTNPKTLKEKRKYYRETFLKNDKKRRTGLERGWSRLHTIHHTT